MMHKPIHIHNLSLSFLHKTCFEDFTASIHFGARIAIIGRNGSGKSTLLQILQGKQIAAMSGEINMPQDAIIGYVPQIMIGTDSLSGGQRFNRSLTHALSVHPNILLLDEPTNHLDRHNRKGLFKMLQNYPGTLIVVSHDTELLRTCIDTFWHIDYGKIHIFTGEYDDYMRERKIQRTTLEQSIMYLKNQKKGMHDKLMQEQQRAAKSKAAGEKNIIHRKWPTITSHTKANRAAETSGQKHAAIDAKKNQLQAQLAALPIVDVIVPTFSLTPAEIGERVLVSIHDGSVGYEENRPVLQSITFSLSSQDRIGIIGDNGSGKSTLVKAILNDPNILKTGTWMMPNREHIGYLDQHYSTLNPDLTVLDTIAKLKPTWLHNQVRRHLTDFLFFTNEEVNEKAKVLSAGEKARLSLAEIAAQTPRLLILDEITNNLDLETIEHVIQVLRNYPGAMIVISHDVEFLREINVENFINLS